MSLARLTEAHRALVAGNLAEAAQLCDAVLREQPDWAAAVHLAGLVADASGDLSRAEDLMRRSLQLPGVAGQVRAEYANNLANLLRTAGFPAAAEATYRHALTAYLLPQARLGLARTLLELDRPDEVPELLGGLPPGEGEPSASLLLSEALALIGERPRALAVLTRTGQGVLQRPGFRLAYGARLAGLGRLAEAEAAVAPLLGTADDAAARLALAEILHTGRAWARALDVVREGVARHAGHVELLSRGTALAWMLGERATFADPLRAAVAATPQHLGLRLALATSLDNAGFPDEAEQVLRDGLAHHPGDSHLNALLATRCATSGRIEAARGHAAAALAQSPELELVREQAAIVALVAGDVPAALEHTGWLVVRRPIGQFALALRVLALRAAGDPAWAAVADPTRVCRAGVLQPPPGYADIAAFNRVLAERLRQLHTLQAHPLINSVRGGTQVEIDPVTEQDPVIREFLFMLQQPIAAYVADMPQDDTHPLYRRRNRGCRLSGCWTVRLTGGAGRHVSHIHPRGWISSAYYVTVPPEIPASAEMAGWLSFGRPPYPIPGLEPAGWVRPEAGRLALFPSYMWHGVEPFPGEGERMTIAFDVVPTAG